MKMVNR